MRASGNIVILFFFVSLLWQTVAAQDDRPPLPGQQPRQPSDEQLSMQYLQNKEYEKAVVLFEKLFEANRGEVYYQYYLHCLITLKDFRIAEKVVRKQIKKYPALLKYQVDLGYVFNESGESQKAKREFDEALGKIIPDKNQVIELANAFQYRREMDYAIETYLAGRRIVREYTFHYELANIYQQTGNPARMIDEYLDLLSVYGDELPTVQSRLQNGLRDDPDFSLNNTLKKSLLKRVQAYPDRVVYAELLIWLSIQQKDFEQAFVQAKSLDRRLKEEGERVYDLAGLCVTNQAYDIAIEAFTYVMKKGKEYPFYINSLVGMLNARFLKTTSVYPYPVPDLLELEKEYYNTLREFGRNQMTISVIRYLGHLQAFFLSKPEDAISLLNEAISLRSITPEQQAECKVELADILLMTGDVWEATLLYSQVEKAFKNDPVGHQAKFKNAKLSMYIGEFHWARAQLDVLKAATSKLIANDALELSLLITENIDADSSTVPLGKFMYADLLLFRNQDDSALLVLDSLRLMNGYHPIQDEVLYRMAEIYMKKGQYAEADSLLTLVIADYPQELKADDALFLLAGICQEKLNDLPRAMEMYEKILVEYPGSLYAVEARKRYRELRGDPLN